MFLHWIEDYGVKIRKTAESRGHAGICTQHAWPCPPALPHCEVTVLASGHQPPWAGRPAAQAGVRRDVQGSPTHSHRAKGADHDWGGRWPWAWTQFVQFLMFFYGFLLHFICTHSCSHANHISWVSRSRDCLSRLFNKWSSQAHMATSLTRKSCKYI